MNICFYGVGGVGGYYGTLLTKYCNETGKGKTYFIARGEHKDVIVKSGLLLRRKGGKEEILAKPYSCTDSINDLPVFDMVKSTVLLLIPQKRPSICYSIPGLSHHFSKQT